MDVTPGRRERRKQRVREELLRSARTLIAERGLANVRVADITEMSDVGMGSFYRHFTTKEELISAIIDDAGVTISASMGELVEAMSDPAEALASVVHRIIAVCRTDPDLAALLIGLQDVDDRFERLLRPQAERLLAQGAAGSRFALPDPEQAFLMLAAVVLSTIRGVVGGRLPADGTICAEAVLRLVGIPVAEAAEVSRRTAPVVAALHLPG